MFKTRKITANVKGCAFVITKNRKKEIEKEQTSTAAYFAERASGKHLGKGWDVSFFFLLCRLRDFSFIIR